MVGGCIALWRLVLNVNQIVSDNGFNEVHGILATLNPFQI